MILAPNSVWVCFFVVLVLSACRRANPVHKARPEEKLHSTGTSQPTPVPKHGAPTSPVRLRLVADFPHQLPSTIFDNFAAGTDVVVLGDGEPEPNHPGVVQTWRRDPMGQWRRGQRIPAPDRVDQVFGNAVAVADGWLAVGDEHYCEPADEPTPCPGVVHLYREEGGTWRYKQRLDDGITYPSKLAPAGSHFGRQLSMTSGVLLVGGDLGTWLYELEGARWGRKGYEHQCGTYPGRTVDAATNGSVLAYGFPEPKKLGSCHNGPGEMHAIRTQRRKAAALRVELRERVGGQWKTVRQLIPQRELFIVSYPRNYPTVSIEFCADLLLVDDGRLFSAYRRLGEEWSAVPSAWINQVCESEGRRRVTFGCSRGQVIASNPNAGFQLRYGTPEEPSPQVLPMPEGSLPSFVKFAASDEVVAVAYGRELALDEAEGEPSLPPINGIAIFEWSDAPASAP